VTHQPKCWGSRRRPWWLRFQGGVVYSRCCHSTAARCGLPCLMWPRPLITWSCTDNSFFVAVDVLRDARGRPGSVGSGNPRRATASPPPPASTAMTFQTSRASLFRIIWWPGKCISLVQRRVWTALMSGVWIYAVNNAIGMLITTSDWKPLTKVTVAQCKVKCLNMTQVHDSKGFILIGNLTDYL